MDIESIERRIDDVAGSGVVRYCPCAGGTMPFRIFDNGHEETLVLIHGGSGSWSHWIRNIPKLKERFNLIVPDLPGLGKAATLSDGYTAGDAAHWVGLGIKEVLGNRQFHLAAFSWGCIVSAMVARTQNAQVKSLLLIGPAGLGEMSRRSGMKPLIRRTPEMSLDEIFETNRENLARLMIHNRSRIDDLAVYLQTWNTNHSRFNSPQFALTTLVLDSLKQTTMPLSILYGEFDAPAYPNFDVREKRLREARSDLQFEIVPDAGHWLQYEVADCFNTKMNAWIVTNSRG